MGGYLKPPPAVIGPPNVCYGVVTSGAYLQHNVKVTVFPNGPHFSDAELRWGNGEVALHGKLKAPSPKGGSAIGRHGKVSVHIMSDAYIDGWSHTGGRVRPKFDGDDTNVGSFDPRSGGEIASESRGITDQAYYKGGAREQRFSVACHNGDTDWLRGLEPPPIYPEASKQILAAMDIAASAAKRAPGAHDGDGGSYEHKVQNPVLAITSPPPAARSTYPSPALVPARVDIPQRRPAASDRQRRRR